VIAGHFGLAAAVKSKERQVPLWALMLATVWLDIVFAPLFLAGLETIQPIDGGGYGRAIIHADYTHSLVGALVLGTVFGGVAALRWGRRTGVVLGAVVFSHWVLDLIVHRMDLPILPGNLGDLPLLGFGLWRSPAASIVLELGLVMAGSYLYWRAAEEVSRSADEATRRRARVLAVGILAAGIVTLLADVVVG
jgi:hypothetical protein